MNENLKWEKKKKLNFTNLLDKINEASNLVVQRELNDIASKIEGLQKMGLIKDNDAMIKMREQLKNIKIGKKENS